MSSELQYQEIDDHDFVAYRKISLSQFKTGAIVKLINDEGQSITFEVVEPMGVGIQPTVRILACTVPSHGINLVGKEMQVMKRFGLNESSTIHGEVENMGYVRISTGLIKSLEGIDVSEDKNEMEALGILLKHFRKGIRETFDQNLYFFAFDLAVKVKNGIELDIPAEEMREIARVLNEYFYSNYVETSGPVQTYEGNCILRDASGKSVKFHLKASILLSGGTVVSFEMSEIAA
mgnify:CR=1 FL=1